MCAYQNSFLVEDASGARFQIHLRCGRFLSRKTRYQLDTGELAKRVDDHVFVLFSTGEPLMRV